MSDTQTAMREFRFLEEKRSRGELSDAEAHRWHELREALGFPPVDTGYADPNAYAQQYGYYASDGNWYPYPLDAYGRPYDPNYPPEAYGYPAASPGEYPAAPGYAPGYESAAYAQPATTPGWAPNPEPAPSAVGGNDFSWSETTQASAAPQATPWPGPLEFSNDELGALGDLGLEDTQISARPKVPALDPTPVTEPGAPKGPLPALDLKTQPDFPRPTGHLSIPDVPLAVQAATGADGSEPTLLGSPLFPEPTAAELAADAQGSFAEPQPPATHLPIPEPAPSSVPESSPKLELSTPAEASPVAELAALASESSASAAQDSPPASASDFAPASESLSATDFAPAAGSDFTSGPAAEGAPLPTFAPVAESGPAADLAPASELTPAFDSASGSPLASASDLGAEAEPALSPASDLVPSAELPPAVELSEPEPTAPLESQSGQPAAGTESLFGTSFSLEEEPSEPAVAPEVSTPAGEAPEPEVLELAEADVAAVEETPSPGPTELGLNEWSPEGATASEAPVWRAELPAAPVAPTDWAPPVPVAALAPPASEPLAPSAEDDEVMELDASDLQPLDEEPEAGNSGSTEWGAVPEPDLPVLDLAEGDLSVPAAPAPAPRPSTVELSAELQRELSEGLEDDGLPLETMAESVNASAFEAAAPTDGPAELGGAPDEAVEVVSPSEFMMSVPELAPSPAPPAAVPAVLAGEEEAEVDWNESAVAASPPPPAPPPPRTRSLEVDISDLEGRFTPLEVPAARPRAAGGPPTLELPIVEAPIGERGNVNAFVPGEHRVIIHTLEGLVKRGVLRDVDLLDESIPLEEQLGTAPERIATDRLKAIFFMAPAGSRPPTHSGRKVRVTFKDGRQVAGFSDDFTSSEHGFFVVPADQRTNTARIYIFRASIQGVAEG